MTEQELLAQVLCDPNNWDDTSYSIGDEEHGIHKIDDRQLSLSKVIPAILTLIKHAGYVQITRDEAKVLSLVWWEECQKITDCAEECKCYKTCEGVLAKLRERLEVKDA